MAKPQWLKDIEQDVQRPQREYDTCFECKSRGMPVKMTRHKDKEWTEVFACAKHPNCFNTKYSICCDDFARA